MWYHDIELKEFTIFTLFKLYRVKLNIYLKAKEIQPKERSLALELEKKGERVKNQNDFNISSKRIDTWIHIFIYFM